MKKISSKLGTKGVKRSGILRWFQKCVELLRQEVPKDFFPRKMIFFAKFSKSLTLQFFCKFFFPFSKLETSAYFWNQRKIPLLSIPCTPNFEEIFFSTLFSEDNRSNKIETGSIFQKNAFINLSRISRPNQKHLKHIEFLKKWPNPSFTL